jgi:hypothetical protein
MWRQAWELESPAALEADGLSHAMAVRHARDSSRRHVIAFVEKHHHGGSGKGKSSWT